MSFARRLRPIVVTAVLLAVMAAPLLALDAKVVDLRAGSTAVRAVLELKGVFKGAQKQLVDDGGTLYVRVQAELWEDRPAWDRLVGPMRVAVFRIRRDRVARRVTIADANGTVTPYADFPEPLGLDVEVAPVDRLQDDTHYYLHALTTVGATLDKASGDVGEVVFGRDEDASGLAVVGKLIFKTAQQISDYLQNITADVTSRKMTGRQIKAAKR
jgi:hypothetical protein